MKPSFNLVRYFMAIGLWILKILFAWGLMNSRRRFLSNIKVSEFLKKEKKWKKSIFKVLVVYSW